MADSRRDAARAAVDGLLTQIEDQDYGAQLGLGDDDRELMKTAEPLGLIDISPTSTRPSPVSFEARLQALQDLAGKICQRLDAVERKLTILDDLADPVTVYESARGAARAARASSSGTAAAMVGQWLTGQDHTLGRLTGIERRLAKLERASKDQDNERGSESLQGFA